MTAEQVDDTVFSKRMWIYRNLAEWRDLNAARVAREWVSGESFLYLGRHYRLDLVREQDELRRRWLAVYVVMAVSSLSSGILVTGQGWTLVNLGSPVPVLAIAAGLMWLRC